jgi:rod shape-determining protein MreC
MALYSRPRNTRMLVVTLVMASLLTITVDYRGGSSGPFEIAGKSTLAVVGALQGAVRRVVHPFGAFFGGLVQVGSLRSENQRLKAEIQVLQQQRGKTVTLERQLAELSRLAHLRDSLKLSGVTAGVVGQSVGNFEWSITVNRGSTSGVKVDDAVVTGDGLVGHVLEVAPNVSKVQLILDPQSAVAGRLASSGETGLVVGQRDADLRMDLVNPDARAAASEQIVTAGFQGGLYPPEIVIGTVAHVYQVPGALTKSISVRPAVDFSALEFVLVVTGR